MRTRACVFARALISRHAMNGVLVIFAIASVITVGSKSFDRTYAVYERIRAVPVLTVVAFYIVNVHQGLPTLLSSEHNSVCSSL
jgi:hypothetical protein